MSKKVNRKAPKLRFSEFYGDWTEKKLSEISNKISDGIHSTPKYDENGEYYFINGNNLINSRIEFDENTKRIDISEYLKYKSDLTSQTILVSINGTIGNLSFYGNEKIILGKSACYINLKSEENKFFTFYLLQTSIIKNHFNKELTGSTIKNLSLTTIKNTKALFPSEKEQEKIASFLGAVDTRINQLRRNHELLQTYKRGVMQKIFSQQIRFKCDDGKTFPDWENKKLGELTYKVGKKNKDNIQYPIYSINNKTGFVPQSEQFEGVDSNDRGYDITLYKIIDKNTFAYNPARINVGSIGFSGELENIIISSLYVCFKTKSELNNLYLLQYLNTLEFNKSVLRNVEGGV